MLKINRKVVLVSFAALPLIACSGNNDIDTKGKQIIDCNDKNNRQQYSVCQQKGSTNGGGGLMMYNPMLMPGAISNGMSAQQGRIASDTNSSNWTPVKKSSSGSYTTRSGGYGSAPAKPAVSRGGFGSSAKGVSVSG